MGKNRKTEPFFWNKGIYDLHWSNDQYQNKLNDDYACSI